MNSESSLITGETSDGYHTFNELYEHRITLYISLCKKMKKSCWISKSHSDGSVWEGWFLLGLFTKKGKQITYHLPNSKWEICNAFAKEIPIAPKFDGHTSDDVLKRIALL